MSSKSENRSIVVSAIAIIVVLLGAAGWIVTNSRGEPERIPISQLPSADPTTTPTPIDSRPTDAAPSSRPASGPVRAPDNRRSGSLTPGPVESVVSAESSQSAADIEADGKPIAASPAPAETGSVSADPVTAADIANDGLTYSAADRDVQPPSPLRPDLVDELRQTRPGVRLNLLSIAIVVTADGTVESVKGMNSPNTLSEFLLLTQALSVVKSWRFVPAVRNGVPVKYRQIVPLSEIVRAPD